jgi:hypothetical protein
MLAQVFLVVIATCSIAFLVYFEVMLLRELKQRVLIMSLTERLSSKKPRVLHIHQLEAIHQQRSERSRKSWLSEIFCARA